MAAMSPSFAAANPPAAPRPAVRPAAPSLAGFSAASVRWPLGFVLVGVASLLATVGCLLARPEWLASYHYSPPLLAVTHLCVLGFVASIVMGAMYQLVPVTLETQLFSERLVKFHFAGHGLGLVGMVYGFWSLQFGVVGAFGLLLSLSVGLFVLNLGLTLGRAPGWHAVKFGMASCLFWLSATVLAGLLLAVAKFRPLSALTPLAAMHAHAHLGVVGVFMLLIVAVSYKLVPMFVLSELQSPRRAWWSLGLINFGLLGGAVAIACESPLKLACAAVIVAGLALYGLEMLAILVARHRRSLDWGMRYFLTAIGLLVPLAFLALMMAWSGLPAMEVTLQLESVYGLLGLLGVVGLAILGMLYKIVPFLVWFHSYSRQIGRAKVPSLAEMYSVPLQIAGYWTYLAGLGLTAGATTIAHSAGIRCGCALLAVSLALFTVNLGKMLAHFLRPQIQPFPSKAAKSGPNL